MPMGNPYIPEKKAEIFVIDRRAFRYCGAFEKTILSYKLENISGDVSTHPDMSFCPLNNNTIAVEKNSFMYYKDALPNNRFHIIQGNNQVGSEYPNDIAFNCVILNGCLFHNLKYTEQAILKYAQEHALRLVNVKQGYTKCSTLIVDSKSVITSDAGLIKKYRENGIDAVLVTGRGIALEGYKNGFIGGTGGLISKDCMAFFGNIFDYPDYNIIRTFLDSRKIKIKALSDELLRDYGSIIPLT